jgi:hypothetical protein
LVAPSTFNATVSEGTEALATILASAAFIASITEGAVAADQLVARFLWELIDDSQTVSWGDINNNQTPTWAVIANEQPVNWSALNTDVPPGWSVIYNEQTGLWQVVNTQD